MLNYPRSAESQWAGFYHEIVDVAPTFKRSRFKTDDHHEHVAGASIFGSHTPDFDSFSFDDARSGFAQSKGLASKILALSAPAGNAGGRAAWRSGIPPCAATEPLRG